MLGILGLLGVAVAGMMMVPVTRADADDGGNDTDNDPDDALTEEALLPRIPLDQLDLVAETGFAAETVESVGMMGVENNDPGVLPAGIAATGDSFGEDEDAGYSDRVEDPGDLDHAGQTDIADRPATPTGPETLTAPGPVVGDAGPDATGFGNAAGPFGMLGVETSDAGILPEPGARLETNVEGGPEDDVLIGTEGADRLDGGAGNDSLSGAGGNDMVHGGAGNDALEGGEGNDDLYGHIGDDSIAGGAGDDSLNGGDGADILDGGAGNDAMTGSFGDDTLSGGAGADVIMGGEGDDLIDGRDGDGGPDADYLNGGLGNDSLWGDVFDTLSGGDGADTFWVGESRMNHNAETDRATIHDYDADEDTLVLLYNGEGAVPVLTQETGKDGVTILADGAPVAYLRGMTTVDLALIEQVAS